ncbi:MAG: alpha-hydroxy-acid oxidizing protein [Chloroflexi bacterium]|nr:alpha-hydroxy-acid oxidizing protein [Chloroflexota bacterium]
MSTQFVSNEQIIQVARRNLAQGAWDYLVGGSESETTMRRNRLSFDRIAFRPRVLVDVSSIDPSTTFLGHRLRTPVMLAPLGSLQTFAPEGAAAVTKAAAEFGTMHVLSSVTQPSLEETAASAGNPKVFQLYIHGDWAWIEDIVGRAKQAGYMSLCLTVDTAHYSRRERPMLSGWAPPTRRGTIDRSHQASLTWETAFRIKEMAGLPFMLKGIGTAEDAALAVEGGVDVIWVSNHGGRQLDHGLGTMDMLREVVDAVGGRADIVVDGGIQRGADVAKAVALGARAVAIGRLQGFGLAAAGAKGVVRVLEILEDELVIAMGLMGVTCIDQLTPAYVCEAEAVTPPHEMSAWINMPGGRIM